MADAFTPVATQIQPPNPMGGLQAYSTLLGIQQQRQNLQTGQYLQQTEQAGAQRAQMDQQQYQAVGSVIRDPSNYDENGSMTPEGRTKLRSVAPNLADEAYQQAVKSGEATTRYKGAMLDLSNAQRQTLTNAVAGVVSNGGDAEAVGKTLDKLVEADPQLTEASRRISGLLSGAKDPQHFQAIAAGIAQGANAPAGEKMRPSIVTYQGPKGLQALNLNAQAPGGVAPVGAPLPQGLAPTEQPGYKGQLAGVEADTQAYQGARIADAHAPRVIALAKALQDMSTQGSAAVANNPTLAKTLRSLGVESAGVANTAIMDKLTATLSREMMAAPRSDADQHEIQNMLPDVSKGPEAVRAAADQIIQRAQYDQGKFSYMEKRGISNSKPMGAADAENQYTRSTAAPPTSQKPAGSYGSAADVQAAWKAGKLTRAQAKQILISQFGMH